MLGGKAARQAPASAPEAHQLAQTAVQSATTYLDSEAVDKRGNEPDLRRGSSRKRGFSDAAVTAKHKSFDFSVPCPGFCSRFRRTRANTDEGEIADDRRHCTDTFFLLLIVLYWIGMVIVTMAAFNEGNPARLIYGTDAFGTTCGTGEYTGQKYVYFPRLQEDLVAARQAGTYNPFDPTRNMDKIRFYGVCVSSCPATGDTVTDAPGNATWPVRFDTANILFRCIAYNDVHSNYTISCLENQAPGAKQDISCQNTWNCQELLLQQHPDCTQADLIRTTRTIKPAQNDPIYNLLTQVVAVVQRWFGDLMLSIPAIIFCGGFLTMVVALLYLVILQHFAKQIVWFTIWLAYGLLLFLTVIMSNWGGLLDTEGSIRNFALGIAVSTTTLNVRERDEFSRTQLYYRYAAYILMACDFIALCLVCYMRDKIGIAVGIIREASRAIRAMPYILLFPFIPCALGIATMLASIVTAGYIASSGEREPTYEYPPAVLASLPGNFTNYTGSIAVLDTAEAKGKVMMFHVFGLLWTQNFFFGVGAMTVSGAVAEYYWGEDKKAIKKYNIWPVCNSFFRAIRYHMGSLALGSLIIAILQFLRGLLFYIDKQTKKLQERSCALKLLFKCAHCFMWCFEKCVRFVGKNGYIIIAIKGGSFCSSSREAASLIFHNLGKIGTVQVVSQFVLRLGKVCCVVISMLVMLRFIRDPPAIWFPIIGQVDAATRGLATVSNPILPMLGNLILSMAMSSYVFTVYQLTVDTILLCFCEDLRSSNGQGHYMSPELLYYISKQTYVDADESEQQELEAVKLEHQESLRAIEMQEFQAARTTNVLSSPRGGPDGSSNNQREMHTL